MIYDVKHIRFYDKYKTWTAQIINVGYFCKFVLIIIFLITLFSFYQKRHRIFALDDEAASIAFFDLESLMISLISDIL